MPAFASPFQAEPPAIAAPAARSAVLLCNLGTPDAPTPAALRRYLAEFLSDERVVEIPRPVWKLILHGIILRTRPAKSATKYASIWTPEGSPLRVWTVRQAQLLQAALAASGQTITVRHAMRYGSDAIPAQLNQLKAEGIERVLILPAYPQYSATTTASVFDAVYAWGRTVRRLPELRFVNGYHADAGYINALASHIRAYWQQHGQPDQLVMSFHGVPERTRALGDPYHDECQATAKQLAQALALESSQYTVTFQSRFGKAKWLAPYTEPTLKALAKAGTARVDVVCPGFTSDCLETLEEIAQEARHAFISAGQNGGGQAFHYIPCLNDNAAWVDALAGIARRHMGGWE